MLLATSRRTRLLTITLLSLVALSAQAQELVPNGSLDEGTSGPIGWTLNGSGGAWSTIAADGAHALSVTGDGKNDCAWLSQPIPFAPSTTYRLRFQVRQPRGASGTAVSGPVFCNRDLGVLQDRWTAAVSYLVTPRELTDDIARLRFGQWQVDGQLLFDDIHLEPVMPVYRQVGDLKLGEGELVSGNRYSFEAPLANASANQSRPLVDHQCMFNSNRWVFNESSVVIYRHELGRRQSNGIIQATIGWYQQGELVVSVSTDGATWEEVGALAKLGTVDCQVPAKFLPAESLWVRLTARKKSNDAAAPSLQVYGYHYACDIDGTPIDAVGATRFVAVTQAAPQLAVSLNGLGDAIPGGDNQITLALANRTEEPLHLTAQVQLSPTDVATTANPASSQSAAAVGSLNVEVPAHSTAPTLVHVPYTVSEIGAQTLRLQLTGDAEFSAETTIEVPALHAAHYGHLLPGSNEQVGLWWCSSGWKVSQQRPLPDPSSALPALEIATAANEAEAAQLVIRPSQPLTNFTATVSDLTGPHQVKLDREHIQVLRVRYVSVAQPTDSTSTIGAWPDPLPPLRAPLALEANRNFPLWICARVPASQPAGEYQGTITLQADGYQAQVPLTVRVFGFQLPSRMTCQTAFGFDVDTVRRYHGLQNDAQFRQVLEKYWQCLADHHISPYEPAPLDPIRVTWKNLPAWSGGAIDTTTFHGGRAALKLVDDSPTASVSADHQPPVAIPDTGIKLSFWYKTERPDQRALVTLSHDNAKGRWLSGRNNDLSIVGNGTWQRFESIIKAFPETATSLRLTLRATEWREDGSLTGTVWFDDVSMLDQETGKELLTGGDFEKELAAIPEAVFDFAAWDVAMRRATDDYHFNTFRLGVPGLGGGTFHERYEPELLGFAESTPQYQGAMQSFLGQMQTHLREQGWLDEAFVYWFDEPDPKDYEFVSNGFGKLKRWAPEIRRMLTEQIEPGLIGGPNIWCPLTPSYDEKLAAERRAVGESFWWYVCTGPKAPYCTLFIDHPATEMRVWLWQTWQRDIAGVLVWDTNYWTSSSAYPDPAHPQNPYDDPMGWVSGYSTPDGSKQPWGNGDGRFLYPPEAAANGRPTNPVMDAPVSSIRLEMLRDGLEDYEYLCVLRALLAKKREILSAAHYAEYSALLTIPPTITSSLTTFTLDPAPLEQHRAAVAHAIEELTE